VGTIDEVQLFNRALTAAEINFNHASGFSRYCKLPALTCATNKAVDCAVSGRSTHRR